MEHAIWALLCAFGAILSNYDSATKLLEDSLCFGQLPIIKTLFGLRGALFV